MPLAFALVMSALLHVATITMPGWELPGTAEPSAPPSVEARLLPPAAPVAARTAPTKPRAAPRALAAKPVPAAARETGASLSDAAPASPLVEATPTHGEPPLPATAAEPAVVAPTIAKPVAIEPAAPPSASATTAQPVAPPWPLAGRVRYVVTYGDGGFVIGETVQEWRVDATAYSIRSVATPLGLAALRGKTRTQSSAGEVTAAGLRPREFRDQREGRPAESASFDWEQARVTFSGDKGEGRLTPGTQDMISVFYQLAWLAPRENIEMAVATAGRLGRWNFEWLGEETIAAAGALVATLHLRTRADGDLTEVWLAPAHGGLPVKIRHVDRKGDTFEQTADILEIQG